MPQMPAPFGLLYPHFLSQAQATMGAMPLVLPPFTASSVQMHQGSSPQSNHGRQAQTGQGSPHRQQGQRGTRQQFQQQQTPLQQPGLFFPQHPQEHYEQQQSWRIRR
jgi:hypothetical protein